MKNLLTITLALFLSSCATIFKTDKGEVPIAVAPGTGVFLKNGDSLAIGTRRDGTQFVTIDPKHNQLLVFKKDTNTRVALPNEYVEDKWYWGNLVLFPGFLVDGYTGNWHSYEEIPVVFSPEDKDFIEQQKLQRTRYYDTLRGIFSDDPKIFAYLAWGVASPVYQTPVMGNVLLGGIGYRAFPWLDVCAETEFAGSLDLGKFNQGGGIIRYGAALRVRPLAFINVPGWYVTGGIGLFDTFLHETSRYISSTQTDTIPAMQKTIPGMSYGLGYSGEYFQAEWRNGLGLKNIAHPRYGEFTPKYSAVTIGLNLYF